MIHKRLHVLNTNILGRKVPHDYKDRGKYSRMWATPSTTINDIVNILFKAYPIKNKTADEIEEEVYQNLGDESIWTTR
jgi:hypothetical protein